MKQKRIYIERGVNMKKTVKKLPEIIIITGNIHTRQVYMGKKPLSYKHSVKVINHSPTGFMWGYAGSGPAQLALAILLTRTKEETAVKLYQRFKFTFIATLPQTDFEIGIPVDAWIKKNGGKIEPHDEDFGFDNIDDDDDGGSPCGVKCLYAEGDDCRCSCDGANHGSLAKRRQLAFF
jgi:hypothetical protein